MEKYPPYQSIFAKLSYGESQMLDKAFYEEEVKRLCFAFEQQVCISLYFESELLSSDVSSSDGCFSTSALKHPDYVELLSKVPL